MTLKDQADHLLEDAVAAGNVPGVVVLATDKDGVFYDAAVGERAKDIGPEMTLDTVIWIASMTKAITGVAAMQQVERGALCLDTPACDVLPELADRQVLDGFLDENTPKFRAAEGQITLRNLLTHSSGFVYDLWNADMAKYAHITGAPRATSCENKALSLPLYFDPDTEWDYGIGIDFVGKMVEKVTGQTLGVYFQENIFAPLRMDSTGFKITNAMRAVSANACARRQRRLGADRVRDTADAGI